MRARRSLPRARAHARPHAARQPRAPTRAARQPHAADATRTAHAAYAYAARARHAPHAATRQERTSQPSRFYCFKVLSTHTVS